MSPKARILPVTALLVAAVWLFAFWWFACAQYLKLPHAGAVAATMLVIAFLFATALIATFHLGFEHNPVTQTIIW